MLLRTSPRVSRFYYRQHVLSVNLWDNQTYKQGIVETQLGRGAENRLLSSALHAPDARVNDQVTLTIEDSRILLFNSNDNRITA